MKSYLFFLNRFRWAILFGFIVLTVTLTAQLGKLGFEGSYRIWFAKDSATLRQYDDFRATFGSDDTIIIAFSDTKGIFNPKALKTLERLSQKLSSMDHIARVDSLLNYQYIHADPSQKDEIVVENFISNVQNITLTDCRQKRDIALHDPILNGLFISNDGRTTLLLLKLTPFASAKEDIHLQLIQETQKILDVENTLTGYDFYISGTPAINAALITIADTDAAFYIPIAFLIIIVCLALIFRNIYGVIIPLSIVLVASVITLYIYMILGYELNNFTINIPIFITGIGIADAIHFYGGWSKYRKKYSNRVAIIATLNKNILPMFLTTITTTIGFATLISSDIVPISTLGLTVAIGSMSALGLTLVLIPVILLIRGEQNSSQTIAPKINHQSQYLLDYGSFITRNDKKIVFIALISVLVVGSGIYMLRVDSNSIKYFSQDVPVSQASYYTMDHITGPATYEIIIDSGQNDGIKSGAFLKLADRFSVELSEKFNEIRHTSSLIDILKRFQNVMDPFHSIDEKIASSQEINAQYLLLYSLSLPQGMEINDKMDVHQRYLRMSVQADIVDSSRTLEIIAWSEAWWKKQGLKVEVVGQTAMFAQMESSITMTLIMSIFQTLALITIIIYFFIRSWKLLIVFLVPNLIPIILTLGLMGWFSIPIDVGIAIAGAIVLGLAVDDTIYFFSYYLQSKKYCKTPEESYQYILDHSGRAMMFTTLILSVSFSLFLLSDFIPNVHFSIMTITTLLLALLCDLILTPALLNIWIPFKPKEEIYQNRLI